MHVFSQLFSSLTRLPLGQSCHPCCKTKFGHGILLPWLVVDGKMAHLLQPLQCLMVLYPGLIPSQPVLLEGADGPLYGQTLQLYLRVPGLPGLPNLPGKQFPADVCH